MGARMLRDQLNLPKDVVDAFKGVACSFFHPKKTGKPSAKVLPLERGLIRPSVDTD